MITRGIFPSEGSLEEQPDFADMLFDLYHNGTHGSYVNLIEGTADIILVARQPSDDELREADRRKVNLDARPVALDAFVFLLNTENGLDDLSLDTIRDIYSGKITSWEDVDPESIDQVINTYQRNPNSGSQELMEKLVMQDRPMVDAPDMILEGMMGPFNAISSDPLGIGYSVYFYAEYIFPSETVKMIGVDGVHPTSNTIAERTYSLTTEVYVVIREGMPVDSTAILLREWLLTEGGQEAVAESGYVPIE